MLSELAVQDEGKGSLPIREIAVTDAEAAARLSGELGYPVSADAISRRIELAGNRQDRAIFVACDGGAVVGWIDVGIVHHLQSEPFGEIGGLVVSSGYRSSGLGKKLVARAEQWAAERGITTMIVRSRLERERAHRFYLREGYSRMKTSAVFSKALE